MSCDCVKMHCRSVACLAVKPVHGAPHKVKVMRHKQQHAAPATSLLQSGPHSVLEVLKARVCHGGGRAGLEALKDLLHLQSEAQVQREPLSGVVVGWSTLELVEQLGGVHVGCLCSHGLGFTPCNLRCASVGSVGYSNRTFQWHGAMQECMQHRAFTHPCIHAHVDANISAHNGAHAMRHTQIGTNICVCRSMNSCVHAHALARGTASQSLSIPEARHARARPDLHTQCNKKDFDVDLYVHNPYLRHDACEHALIFVPHF